MELFGSKKVDRTQDWQRIKEIQELIRTFAGDVDETKVEMAQIHEMMRVKKEETAEAIKTSEEAMKVAEVQKQVFCIHCGSRLPEDGSGCPKCRSSKEKPIMAAPVRGTEAYVDPKKPAKIEKENFCIRCGSKLPEDGSGCASCARSDLRRCPNCGASIKASEGVCPVCHRATLFKRV